jgi:hypothetical protein
MGDHQQPPDEGSEEQNAGADGPADGQAHAAGADGGPALVGDDESEPEQTPRRRMYEGLKNLYGGLRRSSDDDSSDDD